MSAPGLRRPASQKLLFLAQIVRAEADLLTLTDGRLFAVQMDAERAGTLRVRFCQALLNRFSSSVTVAFGSTRTRTSSLLPS